MSDLSDLSELKSIAEPAVGPSDSPGGAVAAVRKISSNRYQTCPCGVRIYDGEQAYAEWCYVETCPCTPNRWPSEWMVGRHGIDEKSLNRAGWEPGAGRAGKPR